MKPPLSYGATRALGVALTLALGAGAMTAATPAAAQYGLQISVYADAPPPPLPVYDQPPIPDEGYIWAPGYWAWDGDEEDYYWVPGTWVEPPEPGLLWTPGYWAYQGDRYGFIDGYWGPQVGYYGGIDYGFGYTGYGYEGGYWRGNRLFYNRYANNFGGRRFENVFERPFRRFDSPRASYNGPGGMNVRPTGEQMAGERFRHLPPTAGQREHMRMAASLPDLRASQNGGRPAIAATPRPEMFQGPGVVRGVRGAAPYAPPAGPGRGPGYQAPGGRNYPGQGGQNYSRPGGQYYQGGPTYSRPNGQGYTGQGYARPSDALPPLRQAPPQYRQGEPRGPLPPQYQPGYQRGQDQLQDRPGNRRGPDESGYRPGYRRGPDGRAPPNPAEGYAPQRYAPQAQQPYAPARSFTPPGRQMAAPPPARQMTAPPPPPPRQMAAPPPPRQAAPPPVERQVPQARQDARDHRDDRRDDRRQPQ